MQKPITCNCSADLQYHHRYSLYPDSAYCAQGMCVLWNSSLFFVVSIYNTVCCCSFLSGIAEPLLPYALSFAAGAMVFVVVDDIIPEAQSW